MQDHLIFLNGEIPRFGSGWRKVRVLQSGPKWVHLEYPATGKRARVRRPEWMRILTGSLRAGSRNLGGNDEP